MDTTQLVNGSGPIYRPPVSRGFISKAPATFSEGVFVILPEGSTTREYGPCKWGAIHGKAKPAAGASCVVTFDEQNFPTIVWWEGEQVEPEGTVTSVAMAYRNATQKIKSGVFERIKIDKAIKEGKAGLINTTEGWYLVPAEGYYHVDGSVRWPSKFPNSQVSVYVNGSLALGGSQSTANGVEQVATGIVPCKAGDKIEVWAYQESGEELSIGGEESSNRLSVSRVGEGERGPKGEKGEKGEGTTLTGKAPVKVTGTEIEILNEGILNGLVKKETLEPNRLEKEKLVSEQVKEHGLLINRLKEGELVNAYLKKGVYTALEKLEKVVTIVGEALEITKVKKIAGEILTINEITKVSGTVGFGFKETEPTGAVLTNFHAVKAFVMQSTGYLQLKGTGEHLTGGTTYNDHEPELPGTFYEVDATGPNTSITITGWKAPKAPSPLFGVQLEIANNNRPGSGANITLLNESAGSEEVNQFRMPANQILEPGQSATFVYGESNWVMVGSTSPSGIAAGGAATTWVSAIGQPGVDPTGVTDSTIGLLNALELAYSKKNGLFIPGGKYKLGEPGYGFDLSKATGLKAAAKEATYGVELYCAADCELIGISTLEGPGKPVVRLVPPATAQPKEGEFLECYFKLGRVITENLTHKTDLVETRTINDSTIIVESIGSNAVLGRGRYGLFINPAEAEEETGFGNNLLEANFISASVGLNLWSEKAPSRKEVSGNQFRIGHISSCAKNGIAVDLWNPALEKKEEERNSRGNIFRVGAIEVVTEAAIADCTGYGQQYEVGETDGNLTVGFELKGTPTGAPRVTGAFTEGTKLNGHTADLTNLAVQPKTETPGVKASAEELENTYERHANVMIQCVHACEIVKNKAVIATLLPTERISVIVLPGEKLGWESVAKTAGSITWVWQLV